MWTPTCSTASLTSSRKAKIWRFEFPVRPATNQRSGARFAGFRACLSPRRGSCARGTPRQPEKLAGHDCLGYRDELGDEVWQLLNCKRRRSHKAEGRFSANNGDLLAELVLHGEGIAFFPRFIVEADIIAGRMIEVLPGWSATEIWLTLYYPPCEQLPLRVAAFSDFFEAHVKEICLHWVCKADPETSLIWPELV